MRKKMIYLNLLLVVAVAFSLGFGFSGSSQAQTSDNGFADPAFAALWGRTDSLVANGTVQRSFYWGPTPGIIKQETYTDSPTGTRLVQYFDKSRMEINDPNGNRSSQFFVTNGLLTVELVTGRMQTGSNSFEQRAPAEIDLASDIDDTSAPTYASFQHLMGKAENQVGNLVSDYISRDGTVGPSRLGAPLVNVPIAYYEPTTGHNIPKPIWDFLNASGPVSVTTPSGAGIVTETLNNPWFYATGYPISEAYWANVKVGGQQTTVLIQPFERRVITYQPDAPAAYQVQMGNIGQHYYDWRYNNLGAPALSPTPGNEASNPTPTATPGSGNGLPMGGSPLTVTLTIAKPVVSKGEDQTLTVNTEPRARVTILCTDSLGNRFNNNCLRNAGANADLNGVYAYSWTVGSDLASGVVTVTVLSNLGQKNGATSGTFVIQ